MLEVRGTGSTSLLTGRMTVECGRGCCSTRRLPDLRRRTVPLAMVGSKGLACRGGGFGLKSSLLRGAFGDA